MEKAIGASFVDPEMVVRQLRVQSGVTVVDFGCGSGFFSLAFARAVGEMGKVYAMDILPSALEAVTSHAKQAGLTNIIPQRVNLERSGGTKLQDASVDLILMKDILCQNTHKDVMLAEALRILRVGGRIFIMEWNESGHTMRPKGEARISKDDLMQLAKSVGFIFVEEPVVGDFHFGFIFEKKSM